MADIESTFSYDSDFSKVTDEIRQLVREATNANSVFSQLNKTAAALKMDAARSFAAQAGFAGFKAQIVDLKGSTEQFGEALMKNKLTMKEYFSEAAKAYKKDSKARALAEREVRRAQAAVVGIGDIGGKRKGVLVTPQSLDMSDTKVQLQVASKQYEIFNKLVNQGATELVNWGKNTQWAGRQLTVGLTVPMSIFSTQAIKAFAEVDKEITRFRKVYGSDLTGTVGNSTDEMLSQIQALGTEFVKQYGIASKETIALAADLAAAGLEGQKLANAVNQTTRLMVLGEVDRQDAMKATLSIQSAFNQNSKELAQSIDFLNQVENQTSASLQDLTDAIPKAGPVIQALGGDVKDLSILMTALREGGISAGEGANALKSGLASLISPTNRAIEVSKQFGIDLQGVVKRNKGELMPMLIDFQSQLKGLDDFGKAKVIEEIFGKYQFARISALFDNLNQQGSQTVGMIKLMKMSADELAKKSYSELQAQQNAPSTRLAAMQQQLQEQLVRVGADLAQSLLPVMQAGLDILQKIVDGFNNLPSPIKSFIKMLGGITAAAGPILMLAGIFGNLIGNAIKFGMSIVNMFKKMTGHPVKQLQILSDEELAAKLAADQLTGAYERQRTSIAELNAALDLYIANLRQAAAIAPPGAIAPGPRRGPRGRGFANGGIIYAQNGVSSAGRINGYGGGDTVPAMLEPGEFVINKKSSQRYAPLLRDINQGKDITGYQEGGLIQSPFSSIVQKNQFGLGYGGISGTLPSGTVLSGTSKRFEHQMSLMSQQVSEALGNINTVAVGSLKEWTSQASILWEQSLADKTKLSNLRLPAIPENIPNNVKSILKTIQMFAEVDSKLSSIRGSYGSFASAWDASHQVAGRSMFIDASGKMVAVPEYIGTTGMEPASYNRLINTLGGTGGAGQTEQNRIIKTREKLSRMSQLGYSESEINKAVNMLAGKESPITRTDTSFMRRIINDIYTDSELRTIFNLDKKPNINMQAKESLSYLDTILGFDEAKFGEFRKSSVMLGVLNSIPEAKILEVFGTKNINEIWQILEERFSPIEKLAISGTSAEIERVLFEQSSGLVKKTIMPEKSIEAISEDFNKIKKAYGTEVKVIDSKGREISPEIVSGRALKSSAKVLKRPSGVLAESTEAFRPAINKRGQRGHLVTYITPKGKFTRFIVGTTGGMIPTMNSLPNQTITKLAGGGIAGLLSEAASKYQRGFRFKNLSEEERLALAAEQKLMPKGTELFSGMFLPKYVKSWKPGQIIDFPSGPRSFSGRRSVAELFRRMKTPGMEHRFVYTNENSLIDYGIKNPRELGVSGYYAPQIRVAQTPEEEQLFLNANRLAELKKARRAMREGKALQSEISTLRDARYASQEDTLFGLTEPTQREILDRQKQLAELEKRKRLEELSYTKGREELKSLRERKKFLAENEDWLVKIVSSDGKVLRTTSISRIMGGESGVNYQEGMGVMNEDDFLTQIRKAKVISNNPETRELELQVISSGFKNGGPVKLATGGKLPGYGGGDKIPAMLEPGEFVINKQATAANLPLLEQINGNILKKKTGGIIPGYATGGLVAEAGMMGMNLMFLPMMYEQAKASEGIMQKMLYALVAIQGIVGAIQAAQLVGAIGGKIGGARAIARSAATNPLVGGNAAATALNAGGGKITQMAAASRAGQLTGPLSKVGGLISRVLLSPLTMGAGLAAVTIFALYKGWEARLNDLKEKAAATYKEATEMAKVYNIELKKTSQALKDNIAQAESLGMATAKRGRGQVDKDYAKAVGKDYEKLIDNLKGLGSQQDRVNKLTGVYASLVAQGFSVEQAKEITAEIARQAGRTDDLSTAMNGMAGNIKTAADAMDVLVTATTKDIQILTRTEERVSALNEAYEKLSRQAADNPIQFSISSNELINNAIAIDPQAAREMMQQQLANAGYGEGSKPRQLLDQLDLTTEEGQKRAQLFMRGVALGISEDKLSLPTVQLEAEVNKLTVAEQAKVDLNKQMDDLIKAEQKNIAATNKWADAAIDRIEKEKDAIGKAHEKRMKALEDEGKALQDRADLIRKNSDFYIKQLQKEYDAEKYYQQQRETAASGLESLAKGDIFGYLQNQMKAASDTEQFGREQAIQQIEDTRDNALANLDAAMKVNNDAQAAADNSFSKAMQKADDKITAINKKRSQIIKGFQDIIDAANDVKDAKVGEVSNEQLQKIENAGKQVAKLVPKYMQEGVTSATDMIVENFGTAIGDAVQTVAKDSNLSTKEASKLLQTVLGIFTGSDKKPKKKKTGRPEDDSYTPPTPTTPESQTGDKDAAGSAGTAATTGPSGGSNVGGGNSQDKIPYYYSEVSYTDTRTNTKFYRVWRKIGKNGKWSVVSNSANENSEWSGRKPANMKHKPYNMGGKVLKFAAGNIVPGFGNSDTVSAMLTPGEFVSDATATRRNLPVLQAMNAGATFTVPQLNSANGIMGSENETYNNNVNMPVNITINGSNLTIDQIKSDIYGELVRAKNNIMNSIGDYR